MSYGLEHARLKARIAIIGELMVSPEQKEAKEELISALIAASLLTTDMEYDKACHYLTGINQALGSEKHVGQWINNPNLLVESCAKLQYFVSNNYQPNDTSEYSLRWHALANILTLACAKLALLALILTIGTFVACSFVVTPLVSLLFFIGIAAVLPSIGLNIFNVNFHPFDEDSYDDMIIHNEHSIDKTNRSLISSFSVFARSTPIHTETNIPANTSEFSIKLEPVYEHYPKS